MDRLRTRPGWTRRPRHKVIQMDRRGHAMPGMDEVYNTYPSDAPAALRMSEQLWRTRWNSDTRSNIAQRYQC